MKCRLQCLTSMRSACNVAVGGFTVRICEVLRRQHEENSASTYLAFLHFYTTSPSDSLRRVNGKSSALLTGAHINSSMRTLNATWRSRRAVGRLLDFDVATRLSPLSGIA